MEIEGRSLWDRIGQALVVFAVLFVMGYISGDYGWSILLGVPIILFVGMIVIDAIRNRVT